MQLPANALQRAKNVVHGIQGLVIFLAWAVTIGVFTKPGKTDGRTKYFFTLCWLCIPALVYQSAVPIFQRTKRFANAYAFVVVDGLFAILWFAASIAVTTWVNAGIREGEKKDQEKKLKGCAAFAYGPESKCKLSKVTIAMGVIILFLFLATCGISIRNLIHFRKHGSLPGSGPRAPDPIEDQTKYAFSSNPHDEFDEDLEDRATRPPRREDDEYALLHTTTEDGTHPGRPLSWGREHAPSPLNDFDSADTSYHGGRNHSQSGRHQPHGDTYKESLPPAGTNLNDSSGSSNGRYHGSGAQQLSRPPRYEVSDPFGDDQALRRDDGRSASGERVEFPPANYHR